MAPVYTIRKSCQYSKRKIFPAVKSYTPERGGRQRSGKPSINKLYCNVDSGSLELAGTGSQSSAEDGPSWERQSRYSAVAPGKLISLHSVGSLPGLESNCIPVSSTSTRATPTHTPRILEGHLHQPITSGGPWCGCVQLLRMGARVVLKLGRLEMERNVDVVVTMPPAPRDRQPRDNETQGQFFLCNGVEFPE